MLYCTTTTCTSSVIFVPDGSNTGSSFKLTFMAVHKDSEAGGLADAREMPFVSFLTSLKIITVLNVPVLLKNQVVVLGLLKVPYNPIC